MFRTISYTVLLIAVGLIGSLMIYRTTAPASAPAVSAPETDSFGGVSLRIEYATTTATRERGLGGRETLAPDEAMLFVFPTDDRYGFWMKDTLVPLDIFWLDDKGQVIYIAPDIATSSYPNVFYPTTSARYVLETVAGFARVHSIGVGTLLMLKNLPTVTE